jgi:hypothetical protein
MIEIIFLMWAGMQVSRAPESRIILAKISILVKMIIVEKNNNK